MENPLSSFAAMLRRVLSVCGRGNKGEAEARPAGALLGQDIVLKGTVMSSGDIYLLGKIDGDIVCDRLFFAGDGAVNGKVNARQQIFLNS